MPDNVPILPSFEPLAVPVATDEVSGEHHQEILIEFGPDGTAVRVQDTNAGRLPVGGATLGNPDDAAAGSDTDTASLNALVKRLLQRTTTLIGHVDGLETQLASQLTLNAAATLTSAGSGTADVQVIAATTNLRLLGFSAKEDAATPAEAEFVLRHGTSVGGTPIAHINLGPNESVRDWFGPGGIAVGSGIFLDRVSGTTDLVVHTVVAA